MDMENGVRRLCSKLKRIDEILQQVYGKPKPTRQDPVEVLVATVLSQNTKDGNSSRAYAALRKAYPTWEQVAAADMDSLERVLRPGGLARIKARRIQEMLGTILSDGSGLRHLANMPAAQAEERLLQYKGVGYKTARCVLLFAFHMDRFPIDTHIERILKRVGLLPQGMPLENAHRVIQEAIPAGSAMSLHLNLIAHGRETCHPRNPNCASCPIRRLCKRIKVPGVA